MEKLKKWNEFVQQQTQNPSAIQQNMSKNNLGRNDDDVINNLVNQNLQKDPQFVSRAIRLNPTQKVDAITKKTSGILSSNPNQKVDFNKMNLKLADVLGFNMQGVTNNVSNV